MKILRREQAAQYLGISPTTLDKLRKMGKIEYVALHVGENAKPIIGYTIELLDAFCVNAVTRATEHDGIQDTKTKKKKQSAPSDS